ncbi:hypothetical protein QEN19_000797 [Hanseniaspora menglaensis]
MLSRLSFLPRLSVRANILAVKRVAVVPQIINHLRQTSTTSISSKPSHISSKKMTVDRKLPDPTKNKRKGTHPVTILLYLGVIYISAELIFNYERINNASVNNSLLELRRAPEARELLGSNIKLYGLYPWIFGDIQQVKGHVDITFKVIGNKDRVGVVVFKASRELNELNFVIDEWKLTMEDDKNQTLNILKSVNINDIRL